MQFSFLSFNKNEELMIAWNHYNLPFVFFPDGIRRNEWRLKRLFTTNGCNRARIHHTITIKSTKNATIMVHNSHNRKVHRFSHCNRSHWKRKNTLHHHRLSPHGNCIKHNRSSCLKWKAITNCTRIEPKVIENSTF